MFAGLREASRPLQVLMAAAAVTAVGLLVAAGVLFVSTPSHESAMAGDPVDVGFSQDMSVHHLQGVQMANVARERSSDGQIRQLAFDIETTQLEQVGRMKGWLSLWNQPEVPTHDYMTWMSGGAHAQHGQSARPRPMMPGMATQEELAKLRSLAGPEFDVFFLQLMIKHHHGGAPMMREAVQRAEQPQVRNLAEQMLKAQSTEVEVMTHLLAQRGARPLAKPN